MENPVLIIEGIIALRGWCKLNLPTEDSLVAYDIILIVAISHYTKIPLPVKSLFSSTTHSYTALRHHYNRFIDDGWIKHELSEKDKRIKLVAPTHKLVNTINAYVNTADTIFFAPKASQQEM
jgi:hypothetical protein